MPDNPLPPKMQRLFNVNTVEEMWFKMLNEGHDMTRRERRIHSILPSNPRCLVCYTPFGGIGGKLARFGIYGSRPSVKNPRFCNMCETFTARYPGGAEVVMTMLFADVRGSTSLAEKMSTNEFSHLINQFYDAAIGALVRADALIDKLVGDEVVAFFVPGYAGKDHARKAVAAGQALLRATGHGEPGGPWVPVGVGIHTGTAWMGSIPGANGAAADFTALGDNVNIAARLASHAGAGEVLVSEDTYKAANFDNETSAIRKLDLKGKSDSTIVRVLGVQEIH